MLLEKSPESPLEERRSNQRILKEINSEYPLEVLMLKLKFHYFDHLVETAGEGNGKPLQYSCLENPMDRGSWWAAIYGVTELDTTEVT